MPALSLAPIAIQLQQWQAIYDLGKLVSPTVGIASSSVWGYAAWFSYTHAHRSSSDWKFYALAGLVTLSILPWTILVMMPTNLDLMKRAKATVEVEGEKDGAFKAESVKALDRWNVMNYVRAVPPMVGAWIGLYAALR
jgi:hypothetical protein